MNEIYLKVGTHGCLITASGDVPPYVLRRYQAEYLTKRVVRWDPRLNRAITNLGDFYASDMIEKYGILGIHINHIPDFIKYLGSLHINYKVIKTVIDAPPAGAKIEFHMNAGYAQREYQIPLTEWALKVTDSGYRPPIRVLNLETGAGKTTMTLYCVGQIGRRRVIFLQAREFETWRKSLDEHATESAKTVRFVNGRDKLMKLIADGHDGKLKDSIVFISHKTFSTYLTEYEETHDSTYGVTPDKFMETIGADGYVVDEAHEHLTFIFKLAIHCNALTAWYLSGTLDSNDPFKNMIYATIYPPADRIVWRSEPYIEVTALGYNLEDARSVRYRGRTGMYSHNVFEEWILSRKGRTANYFGMIAYIVQRSYAELYVKEMRMLIFFSSVDMCALAAKFLQQRFPQFKVAPYTGEHDEEELYANDIVCTTILSAGTGKDIPNLAVTLVTTALDSREKNFQVIGRLRRPKGAIAALPVRCYYLVCKDVPTHVAYHIRKLDMFNGRVKSHDVMNMAQLV